MHSNIFETKIYKTWKGLRSRCNNSNMKAYPRYGGRGISYCKRWNSFSNFYKDMNPSLIKITKTNKNLRISLDRINNNNGYSKNNCRWTTPKEQAINRHTTNLFYGLTLKDWSIKLGVKRSTLAQRYYVYRWSINKVLSINK